MTVIDFEQLEERKGRTRESVNYRKLCMNEWMYEWMHFFLSFHHRKAIYLQRPKGLLNMKEDEKTGNLC